MCVLVWVQCAHTHMWATGWCLVSSIALHFMFWDRASGILELTASARPDSQRDPGIIQYRNYTCLLWCHLYTGAGDLNSEPHTHVASTYSAELAPLLIPEGLRSRINSWIQCLLSCSKRRHSNSAFPLLSYFLTPPYSLFFSGKNSWKSKITCGWRYWFMMMSKRGAE